ncbi:hypothetical protein D6825_00120 [Candidatus Woesearchaeota archaeon]|nr:MAG: hypothetical protein D6825_00120 [Candidatus Woesearchaeota archaeon]
MRRLFISAFLLAALVSPWAFAQQLPWDITDLRCGNGKLDEFELCEKGVEEPNFCNTVNDLLKIDTVCDEAHCTCLPRVNRAYCGNDIREGVEMCDGSAEEDFCAELGAVMNLSLKCNPSSCGCELDGVSVPEDYNPEVVEYLDNLSQKASVCGDKMVERDEDCDPPNTLCTTFDGEPGVCTQKCKCVEPGALDEPEEEGQSGELSAGLNESSDESGEKNISQSAEDLNDAETANLSGNGGESSAQDSLQGAEGKVGEEKVAKSGSGLLSRIWEFIVGIFS